MVKGRVVFFHNPGCSNPKTEDVEGGTYEEVLEKAMGSADWSPAQILTSDGSAILWEEKNGWKISAE